MTYRIEPFGDRASKSKAPFSSIVRTSCSGPAAGGTGARTIAEQEARTAPEQSAPSPTHASEAGGPPAALPAGAAADEGEGRVVERGAARHRIQADRRQAPAAVEDEL